MCIRDSKLSAITAAGSYTIQLESPYTLKDADLTAFNTYKANLSNKNAVSYTHLIYFSAADLERMPADFEKKIEAAAQENGGSLTLQKEPKEIPDGFILVYGCLLYTSRCV